MEASELIAELQSRKPASRKRAAIALGSTTEWTTKVLHALLESLADSDGEVRYHAGESLQKAGPAAGKVMCSASAVAP